MREFYKDENGCYKSVPVPVVVKAHASTDKCDFCKGDLKRNAVYYDGLTNSGHWAWMCRDCWEFNGVGLGTGMGQEYDSETNIKVRG